MTQILHVSDTHLDYRQYQNDERRQDYTDAFNHAIDIAIEENVDAVLHTGDLFHDKSPSLGSQIECAEIIQRLKIEPPEEIPFLTIVGNHERKRDHQFVDYLELPNGHLAQLDNEENTPYVVNDDVAIYGFDYIPTLSWESTDLTLTSPETDCFILVAMHQLLHPPVPEIMAQHNTEDILDQFGVDIDALALGDYHQREQTTLNGTRVWYPGSTEKTKEDDGPNHYVDILEFDGSELDSQIRREIPTREFLFIDIDLVDGVSPIEQIQSELDAYDIQDKVVHVTLDGTDVNVTKSQVEDLLRGRDVTVGRCSDARTEFEIDVDAVETEVQNIDAAVDEELGELDLSTTAQEVEQVVRDLNTPKSHVRARADELVIAAAPGTVQENEPDAWVRANEHEFIEDGEIHPQSWNAMMGRLAQRSFNDVFDQGQSLLDIEHEMFHPGRVSVIPTDHLTGAKERLVMMSLLAHIVDNKLDDQNPSEHVKHTPLLLVVDEAHNYLASRATSQQEYIVDRFVEAAKQGRKQRLGLGMVTQNPADIDEEIRNQTNTRIYLGLEEEVVEKIEIPRGFSDRIPLFGKSQMMIKAPDVQPTEVLGLPVCLTQHQS